MGKAFLYGVGGKKATLIAKNITGNGTYLAADDNADGYSSVSVAVQGGGGGGLVAKEGVNFIDYDGTTVATMTYDEIRAATALPDLPEHDGLMARGWNWEIDELKEYVADLDYGVVTVGATYTTADGKTRIYITLQSGRLSPTLGFALNGTAVIDFGDGSATMTVTGTSNTTIINTPHNYRRAGDYVITLSVENGTISLLGGSVLIGSYLCWAQSTTNYANRVYQNAIRKVEIGEYTNIGTCAFAGCTSIETIVVANSTIGTSAFHYCYSLRSLVLPRGTTSLNSACNYCYSMKSVAIPNGITSLSSTLSSCSSLSAIAIPNSVTSIASVANQCSSMKSVILPSRITSFGSFGTALYALVGISFPRSITRITSTFSGYTGLAYLDFTAATSIPTLSSATAFTAIPEDCVIVVPDNLYDTWIAATNWANSASYIIKESDWEL